MAKKTKSQSGPETSSSRPEKTTSKVDENAEDAQIIEEISATEDKIPDQATQDDLQDPEPDQTSSEPETSEPVTEAVSEAASEAESSDETEDTSNDDETSVDQEAPSSEPDDVDPSVDEPPQHDASSESPAAEDETKQFEEIEASDAALEEDKSDEGLSDDGEATESQHDDLEGSTPKETEEELADLDETLADTETTDEETLDEETTDDEQTADDNAADDATVEDVPAETDTYEPTAEPMPASTPAAPEKRGPSAMALLLGGVLAGAIGFGAAYVSNEVNRPPPPEPVDLSGLESAIDGQNGRLDELASQIQPAPDLSGIETGIAEVTSALDSLEARIVALENRPVADPATGEPTAVAPVLDPAILNDLNALRDTVAQMQADSEAAKANAQSAAADTLKRAAVTQVLIAIDTGAPFADAITELEKLGVSVPGPLKDQAQGGVVTQTSLQESFPEAARAGIAAARAEAAESGDTGGFSGFLRSQLGARSLTPQDGDGADAVLSRVEAALRAGNLADALTELETLPDIAKPALSAWASTAGTRAEAVSAAKTLSDSLN